MEPIFIVGAGGIGCAVGHALRAAGAPVAFVEANPNKVRWGRDHGVSVDGQKALAADFLDFADWQAPPGATVILSTKCYDNPQVLSRLPAGVRLLPIQNGFDRDLEGSLSGWEGIASFVSECDHDRTHTRITRKGRLHLGRRGGPGSSPPGPAPDHIVALLRRHAPFRVEVVPDILPFKYTKLMYNAAISPLAAAAGLDNGQLLSIPKARRLFFELIRENYAILKAANIPLGKIGPFHPDTVDRILARLPVAGLLAWAFYPTLRKTYCSMSGDLPRGRTEIEYYNRRLIDLAENRIPCPLNRRVYALVKRMEQERIQPGLPILDEI
jgi:2-dehydropantoate 2-reductase